MDSILNGAETSSKAIFVSGVIYHVGTDRTKKEFAFIDPVSLRLGEDDGNPSLEELLAELGLDMSQVRRIFLHSADVEEGKLIRGYRVAFSLINVDGAPRAVHALVDDESDLAWLASNPKPERKEKEPAQPLNSKESVQQAKKKHRRKGKGKGVNAPAPATAPIAAKAAVEQKPKEPAQHAVPVSKQPVVTIPQPPRDSRSATESAPKGGIFGAVAKGFFALAKSALHK